jgi:NitT/TauT family transport system permease protein
LTPLKPVGPGARFALGAAFFVLFFAAWALATFGGYVSPTFLADPATMMREGWNLLVQHGFIKDILITIWRVFGGFLLAAAVGIRSDMMGGAGPSRPSSSRSSRSRYLPASAFIPLPSSGREPARREAARHFVGSFFQIVLMVAVSVGNTRLDLVEAAYTLGASDRAIVTRVLLPAAAPEIAEISRLVLGWAWTYVIVAELIGASSGIGHMIMDSQALLNTGQIIFGIVVIGVIGLVSDYLFKALNRRLFPWSLA